jgi:hypothetical protein
MTRMPVTARSRAWACGYASDPSRVPAGRPRAPGRPGGHWHWLTVHLDWAAAGRRPANAGERSAASGIPSRRGPLPVSYASGDLAQTRRMLIPSFRLCSSDSDSSPEETNTFKENLHSPFHDGCEMKTNFLLSKKEEGALKAPLKTFAKTEASKFSQNRKSRKISTQRTIVPNFDLDSSQSDNDALIDSIPFPARERMPLTPSETDSTNRGSTTEPVLKENTVTEQQDANQAINSDNYQYTWSHTKSGANFYAYFYSSMPSLLM